MLMAVDHMTSVEGGLDLVRAAFKARVEENLDGIEDRGIMAAMAKILNEDPKIFTPKAPEEKKFPPGKIALRETADTHISGTRRRSTWEQVVTSSCIRSWIDIVTGRPQVALSAIAIIRSRMDKEESEQGAGNLMAMGFWLEALEALANEDLSEARRLWGRALDVGEHFSTDSHLTVSWTFAATFIPKH